MAEYDGIHLIDSKTAVYAIKIMVDYGIQLRDEGKTVDEIVEALEGTYDLEDEVDRNNVGRGDQEAIQHLIIDRINDCVQEILEDVTLKDLVDAYEGYQDSVEGMYYI
jgi:DNA-binding IscR family transcriptional regulator